MSDEFEEMIKATEEAERRTFGDLYSNCVILDFSRPITRAQLREIERRLLNNHGAIVGLPTLRVNPVCGEREGNSVVPSIAADEC